MSGASPAPEGLPRIPGYRLEHVVGRGATGIVYRAIQLAVDRPVALKLLHRELVGTKRAVRRLQREARTAARLAHPNIISAIDMGEVDGQWWYAMELVEGQPLSQRLRKDGPLGEREALRTFLPLCDALQHAYEHGVVHRDIKPANILIDRGGRARLVDLGLAFAGDDPMLTQAGGTLGTPAYISPEQAREPSAADTRSDIWSLGATMFHALCGRPPFAGESVAEILSGVLYHRIPDPRQVAPQVSKGMALVLRKCLARDPDRRYQTPAELAADLERLRERRLPGVRAGSLDPVAGGAPEWLRPALAGGVIVLALLGGWLALARPWELPGGAPQPRALPASWPPLEQLAASFEAGALTLREAQFELERLEVPEAFAIERARLGTRVREALRREINGLVQEVHTDFDALLRERRYEDARELLTRGIDARLLARTGYRGLASVEGVPAQSWTGELEGRLRDARAATLAKARELLAEHLRAKRAGELGALLRAHRWQDAMALVGELPARWAREHQALVAGLSEAEQGALLGSATAVQEEAREDVRRHWRATDAELVRWIEDSGAQWLDKLEVGEQGGAASLREGFERKLERAAIDLDERPAGESCRARDVLAATAGRLEERERALLEADARRAFEEDDAAAQRLNAQRRYASSAQLWMQRLQDAWRAPVHGEIELRLRESDLLVEVLERAAAGVRERAGAPLELYHGAIKDRGRVEVGRDPLLGGFELARDGQRIAFLLAPLPAQGGGAARLVGTSDLEHLAGLSQEDGAEEALRLALFRFHEGQLEAARAALVEARAGDALVDDLERRVARAIELERLQRSERAEELFHNLRMLQKERSGGSPPEKLLPMIREVLLGFGDAIPEAERKWLRSLERECVERIDRGAPRRDLRELLGADEYELLAMPPRGLRARWRFDGPEEGAWRPGRWTYDGGGWALPRALEGDGPLLDRDAHPRLVLRDPYDPHETRLRFVLQRPGDAAPHGLLLVSAFGFHAAFVLDDRRQSQFLLDVTSVEDVLARARGAGSDLRPMPAFPPGAEVELRLVLRPRFGSIEMEWNGELLATRKFRAGELAQGGDPAIELRSLEPLRLVEAELEGQRRP